MASPTWPRGSSRPTSTAGPGSRSTPSSCSKMRGRVPPGLRPGVAPPPRDSLGGRAEVGTLFLANHSCWWDLFLVHFLNRGHPGRRIRDDGALQHGPVRLLPPDRCLLRRPDRPRLGPGFARLRRRPAPGPEVGRLGLPPGEDRGERRSPPGLPARDPRPGPPDRVASGSSPSPSVTTSGRTSAPRPSSGSASPTTVDRPDLPTLIPTFEARLTAELDALKVAVTRSIRTPPAFELPPCRSARRSARRYARLRSRLRGPVPARQPGLTLKPMAPGYDSRVGILDSKGGTCRPTRLSLPRHNDTISVGWSCCLVIEGAIELGFVPPRRRRDHPNMTRERPRQPVWLLLGMTS